MQVWLNKSGFTLIGTLTLALCLGVHTATLGQAKTTPQTAGSLTLKPIVFEVRDKQKVEAESGQLLVTERRGNARTKLIALAFVRFKSTAKKPTSPIIYLAGGPGESGINDFRGVPLELLNEMRAVADVIALDQRGTGSATISIC
jgi:pimeloyl-ACP methyl ester carboxylesterase